MARRDQGAGRLPERLREAWRFGDDRQRVRFSLGAASASSGEMAKAWQPYVDTCIENFGANRCMFESNFPVDKGACSYPVLFNAFKRLANGASASEKADLFAGTASRFYRLETKP